jgi:hypothetical protein
MTRKVIAVATAVLMLIFIHESTVSSQNLRLQCGDIVESEFVSESQDQIYSIELSAGDSLSIMVLPLGATLELAVSSESPIGQTIAESEENESITTPVLSASGTYSVIVTNTRGIGVYTLYIGCTLRDGTVIEPGGLIDSGNDVQSQFPADFSGFGFPGLAPIDFMNGVTIPLVIGVPVQGAISPGFDGIFGFSFEVEEGDEVSLEFAKDSGNLNLGLAVVSAEGNQVVFQSSLITTNNLVADFQIPSDGEYVIGLFRISLIPPDEPETTDFTIEVEINP